MELRARLIPAEDPRMPPVKEVLPHSFRAHNYRGQRESVTLGSPLLDEFNTTFIFHSDRTFHTPSNCGRRYFVSASKKKYPPKALRKSAL